MRVAMIVFSPTGNTKKVGGMIEGALIKRGIDVQNFEISKCDVFDSGFDLKEYLDEQIKPHDLLCIGSPVYAGHLQYNVKKVIKALPEVDGSWGSLAVPFVTWGGVSSGIALEEASGLLVKSGRTNVLGMKINAYHCFTKKFAVKLNEGLPGDEAVPYIEELAERIAFLKGKGPQDVRDISKDLAYMSRKEKIMENIIFRERVFQRIVYPKVKIDPKKCIGCGTCVRLCPVQHYELVGKKVITRKGAASCIHCGECFNKCPEDAVSFKVDRFEGILTKVARGEGDFASWETPPNAVYPVKINETN